MALLTRPDEIFTNETSLRQNQRESWQQKYCPGLADHICLFKFLPLKFATSRTTNFLRISIRSS